MAVGRGAALLSAGVIAIWVAFAYTPKCTHIHPFSTLCIGPWLPVMVTLIVLGGGAIAFGARSLLRGAALSRWRYLAIIAGLVFLGFGVWNIAAVGPSPSHGGVVMLFYALVYVGLGVTIVVGALMLGRGEGESVTP